jgi:hypothetical protein
MEDRPICLQFDASVGEVNRMNAMGGNQTKKIRVGIIGASPDRGWAVDAHSLH